MAEIIITVHFEDGQKHSISNNAKFSGPKQANPLYCAKNMREALEEAYRMIERHALTEYGDIRVQPTPEGR